MSDKEVKILLQSLYEDKGTTAAQKAMQDTAKAGDATADVLKNKLALAMFRAEDAANKLTAAQRNLAAATDPAEQQRLAGEVLKAQVALDNERAAVGRLANDLKKLDASNEQVDDSTKKVAASSEKFSAVLTKLAAGGVLVGIGTAMVGFAKQSIAAASNVEEAASKFGFVFGPAAESAGAALDEFAAAVGRSRYELRETASGFGGILEGMLGSKEAAAEMSVELAKLTTDLASFYNVSEQDAAMAITSGLVGETEPMRRFGVLLNEATIQAKVFEMGLATTKGEITETMKVQARMNLIMEATATAQGDAARTSDSYANQQRAMQAAVQELSVAIGKLLIPAALEATTALGEMARRMQVVFDVAAEGGATVDSIIDGNIANAKSIDDLVAQYARLQDSAGMWGGAAAALTGTQDDLYRNMEKVKSAILDTAENADEYIAALREMGIVGNDMGQMTEEAARKIYEEEKATRSAALTRERAIDTITAYYIGMGKIAEASQEVAEATDSARYSAWQWNTTVQAQASQAQQAAVAMGRKGDAMREAAEAAREYYGALRDMIAAEDAASGDRFTQAINAGRDALIRWQVTYASTGDLREDERASLDELLGAYDRHVDRIQSLESGTAGLGLTTEELSEALAEEYAAMALIDERMGPLLARQGEMIVTGQGMVVNQAAVNAALYAAADAAGASGEELALLGLATGTLSEEQAIAALKAAALAEKINDLGEAIAKGMDPTKAIEELQRFGDSLAQQDFRAKVGIDVTDLSKDSAKIKTDLEAIAKTNTDTVTPSFETMVSTAIGMFTDLDTGIGGTQRIITDSLLPAIDDTALGLVVMGEDGITSLSGLDSGIGTTKGEFETLNTEINTARELLERLVAQPWLIQLRYDIAAPPPPPGTPPPGTPPPGTPPPGTPPPGTPPPPPGSPGTPFATGTGGWLQVPPGYPNDTYPIRLSSGEQFAVVRAGEGMGMQQVNHFHISNPDPKAVAREVSIVLARQTRLQSAARTS